MLNKIKYYFTLDCVTFTIMTVVLSGVYYFFDIGHNVPNVNYLKVFAEIIFSYFAVTTVISFLFLVFEKFINTESIVGHFVAIAIVCSTVYGLGGGVFHWFPVFSYWSLFTLGVIVVVYVIVFLTIFYKNVEDSNKINDKLKEMQEENNE